MFGCDIQRKSSTPPEIAIRDGPCRAFENGEFAEASARLWEHREFQPLPRASADPDHERHLYAYEILSRYGPEIIAGQAGFAVSESAMDELFLDGHSHHDGRTARFVTHKGFSGSDYLTLMRANRW